ncbi:hypothetical protein CC_3479 [Caulobacter vibrioides CB15]|uniref:Uncharacterized protein n=1 Tax=Caulobacter vibrioides (strain ATCC 19089 / CIP 103742 / CB 15) TaxID=190650 RepID=Q9A2S7_CAUVC|nr:hypothetical protein CC_3479 [Caulobacter vibrioides CB15]
MGSLLGRDADRRHRPVLEVDGLEVADAFLGDIVADHALALVLQFGQVDIHGVEGLGAVGDDAGVQQGLHQHPEDVGLFLHVLPTHVVGHDLPVLLDHLVGIQAKLAIEIQLLVRRDQVEQQGLEAVRRPVLDDRVLLGRELGHGAVGPDLPELVVEGLVGHHQLQQLLADRVIDVVVEGGEGAHGQTFDQHLHADDLLVDLGRAYDLDQQGLQGRAALDGLAPAGLDVLGEARHVAGLFAGLVGGVFLGALVLEDVAEAGRQVQRALLAVQDRREIPQHRLVDEPRADLRVRQVVRHVVGRQGDDHFLGNQRLVLHVERLVEIDIGLVQRIPEMVVGRGDDLVERGRAVVVPVKFEHRLEIVRRHRVVHGVLGDVPVGHGGAP